MDIISIGAACTWLIHSVTSVLILKPIMSTQVPSDGIKMCALLNVHGTYVANVQISVLYYQWFGNN
jgi:hypothetical protein